VLWLAVRVEREQYLCTENRHGRVLRILSVVLFGGKINLVLAIFEGYKGSIVEGLVIVKRSGGGGGRGVPEGKKFVGGFCKFRCCLLLVLRFGSVIR
jgi:hypothetical protein